MARCCSGLLWSWYLSVRPAIRHAASALAACCDREGLRAGELAAAQFLRRGWTPAPAEIDPERQTIPGNF